MNVFSSIIHRLIIISFSIALSSMTLNPVVHLGLATSNQTLQPIPDDVPDGQPADVPDGQPADVPDGQPADVPEEMPIATISGPDKVPAGDVFSLDGSGSYDPDGGDIEDYTWFEENGQVISTDSSVTITAPSTNTEQQIVVSLDVVDDEQDDAEASHTITVTPIVDSDIPVATISGPDEVAAGDVFSLNGSGSYDPDGGELEYEWTDESGSVIGIASSVEIAAPSVDAEQEITFSLLVLDNEQDDAEASHTITVTPIVDSDIPVATISGPDKVAAEEEFSLDGSGSYDPSGGEITDYRWSNTDGFSADTGLIDDNNPIISLNSPSAENPTTLSFSLVVEANDGDESAPTTKQITVLSNAVPPSGSRENEPTTEFGSTENWFSTIGNDFSNFVPWLVLVGSLSTIILVINKRRSRKPPPSEVKVRVEGGIE